MPRACGGTTFQGSVAPACAQNGSARLPLASPRRAPALELQQPQLGCQAAGCREAAAAATGCQHPVTGHDDRKWVAAEGLTDRARLVSIPAPRGQFAVGERATWLDRAGRRVDTAGELRDALQVELRLSQVARLALQQRDDVVDDVLDRLRGHGRTDTRQPLPQPCTRPGVARFRQQHGANAVLSPGNPAGPDRRREQAELDHVCMISRRRMAHPCRSNSFIQRLPAGSPATSMGPPKRRRPRGPRLPPAAMY